MESERRKRKEKKKRGIIEEPGVDGRSGKTPRWFVVDWRADQAGGEARVALMLPPEFLFLPTSRCTHSTWRFADLHSTFETFAVLTLWSVIRKTISLEGARNPLTPARDQCPAMMEMRPAALRRVLLSRLLAGTWATATLSDVLESA